MIYYELLSQPHKHQQRGKLELISNYQCIIDKSNLILIIFCSIYNMYDLQT